MLICEVRGHQFGEYTVSGRTKCGMRGLSVGQRTKLILRPEDLSMTDFLPSSSVST